MAANDILPKLRAALQRHGCKVNSHSGFASLRKEVERILGKPLSDTPSRQAQEIQAFIDKGAYSDLPRREFKPLSGYSAGLALFREVAEMTR